AFKRGPGHRQPGSYPVPSHYFEVNTEPGGGQVLALSDRADGAKPSDQVVGPRFGYSAEDLLDDVRQAMQQNPQAAHAAAVRLVAHLTPPATPGPADARGGLGPWQKHKVDRY